MEIQELPDRELEGGSQVDFMGEPLLDYVQIVANIVRPFYDPECVGWDSSYSAIFGTRYVESQLSLEGRFERSRKLGCTYTLDYLREYEKIVSPLKISFKDKFLNNTNLQNTLVAYNLDVSKFWYLLLFVYDFVEDICTNSPYTEKSEFEKISSFVNSLYDSTEIVLKKNGRQSFCTDDEDSLIFIKNAMAHFISTYNDILSTSHSEEEMLERLQAIGMESAISDCGRRHSRIKISPMAITYKKWLFTKIFLDFLADKKADRNLVTDKTIKVSTDKLMLISRLIYIIGYDSKRYDMEYDENGNKNRMLSNLLRKYKDEGFLSLSGRIYMR